MKAYLEVEETAKLENATTCLRDRLMIRVLARLGCRISEALALTVQDAFFGLNRPVFRSKPAGLSE